MARNGYWRLHALPLTALLGWSAGACGSHEPSSLSISPAKERAVEAMHVSPPRDSEARGLAKERPSRRAGGAKADASLRAATIAAVQANAHPEYRFEPAKPGKAHAAAAVNAAQKLTIQASPQGVVQAVKHDSHDAVTLSWTGLGRGRALQPVRPAAGQPSLDGNRMTYRHGRGQRSWYVNGPLGLEQGFILDEPARGRETGEALAIEVTVGGTLAPLPAVRTEKVALRSAQGEIKAWYRDLFAHDAKGRALTSWMEATRSTIRLHIDDANAAYPIVIDPLVGVEQAKLLGADGKDGDQFGWSVALSGDTALVGAWADDDKGNDAGSAYIFVRNGDVWTEQAKLLAADGEAEDWFGTPVALDGNTALIGAPGDDDKGAETGAAYVFVRNGNTWNQQAKLLADDAKDFDYFGYWVAISGNTAVLGAPSNDDKGMDAGAAYIFVRNGNTWTQQAKLHASDGAAEDKFGDSVAIEGDTAVIGAWLDDDKGTDSGAAYVFTRTADMWSEQTKLVPADGEAGDGFAYWMSLSGDSLLLGAPYDDDLGADVGAGYVFVRAGNTWMQQAKLLPSDGQPGDGFAYWVSLSGDTALLGAPYDDDKGIDAGAAYVFARSGDVWTQQLKLTPAGGEAEDYFGAWVSLDGTTALLGTPGDDDKGTDAGGAYVFILKLPIGDLCTMAAECESGFCADGVCCDSACNTGDCDACSAALGASADGACTLLTGTACEDGNGCTTSDTCQAGTCMSGNPVTCSALDECHEAGTCDQGMGTCSNPEKPDGTPCSGGVCMGGVCGGGAGGAGGTGTGGTGGTGGMGDTGGMGGALSSSSSGGDTYVVAGGCGCRTAGGSESSAAWLLLFGLVPIVRRRNRRAA